MDNEDFSDCKSDNNFTDATVFMWRDRQFKNDASLRMQIRMQNELFVSGLPWVGAGTHKNWLW